MNRESKYRAWDKTRQIMVYDGDTWMPLDKLASTNKPQKVQVCSKFIIYPYSAPPSKYVRVFNTDGPGDDYYYNWDYDKFFCDNIIFMQYTDRKDKHEIKIFEDDIIKTQNGVFPVVWLPNHACFAAQHGQIYVEAGKWHQHEVIGNIHQNPELLKD